jgi:hypothetical protein
MYINGYSCPAVLSIKRHTSILVRRGISHTIERLATHFALFCKLPVKKCAIPALLFQLIILTIGTIIDNGKKLEEIKN